MVCCAMLGSLIIVHRNVDQSRFNCPNKYDVQSCLINLLFFLHSNAKIELTTPYQKIKYFQNYFMELKWSNEIDLKVRKSFSNKLFIKITEMSQTFNFTITLVEEHWALPQSIDFPAFVKLGKQWFELSSGNFATISLATPLDAS